MDSHETRDKQDRPPARAPQKQDGKPGENRIGVILLIVTIVIAVALYFYYFMFSSSMGLGSR